MGDNITELTTPEGKTCNIMYEAELMTEEGRQNKRVVSAKVNAPLNIDITRFSSLTKLLRVTVLALRFINKLKRVVQRSNNQLDSEEMAEAEKMWTRYVQRLHYSDVLESIQNHKRNNMKVQLGIYLDSENILRYRWRLENNEITEGARLPILLPKANRYTHLLIDRLHRESFHAGVSQTLTLIRQRYWIQQGLSAVKSVLQRCPVCRHYEGGFTKCRICLLFLPNVFPNQHLIHIVVLTILDSFLSNPKQKPKRYGYIFTHAWLQEPFT